MKILYAGTLTENDTALHRLWALERLGHTVVPLPVAGYEAKSPLLRKILFRLSAGPGVDRLNADVLRMAEEERPDLFWADKMLWIRPSTLKKLRAMGIATVSYMIDNPFGPRRDPGWRLYMKDIPFYDLHVVQRDKNIADYKERGARDVIKIQTAYEPTLNFPPPAGWSDKDCDREVSFIGTPYDDRAKTLTRLWGEDGFAVTVSGNERQWRRALDAEAFAGIFRHGELYRDAYREGIWRSKINLSFLTHSNQDEFVHKSFEIAGCGGFLLAERSEGHLQRFVEGEEAVFFSGYEELVAKIRRYLPDEAARRRIAAAGRARAERDGYHNDRQVGLVLERVAGMIPAVKAAVR
ncbi:CgeB family protein [Granulicella aggregans]|uniref:CgeB family protein n=1 Tax=Granulicella aggregans TaxID=474949 RepID=UPI0021E0D993|nr:glycosyltransferase [Granulicella aggregans]